VEHPSHLYRNVSGTNDDNLLWLLFKSEKAIRTNAKVPAFNVAEELRMATSGNENVVRPNVYFISAIALDFDFVLGSETCSTVYPFYAIICKILFVRRVYLFYTLFPATLKGLPIERLVLRPTKAIMACVSESVCDVCCMPCDFLRDTTGKLLVVHPTLPIPPFIPYINASTAQPRALDRYDFLAVL
jgi:hypothetical protein